MKQATSGKSKPVVDAQPEVGPEVGPEDNRTKASNEIRDVLEKYGCRILGEPFFEMIPGGTFAVNVRLHILKKQ